MVPELHVASRAQCKAAAKGRWQKGTVPAVPGWGAVAFSKASLCASALSPSFHDQFKSSPSLMSLPRSHAGVGCSRNREIIWANPAGVDHGFPSGWASSHSLSCASLGCRGAGVSTWRGAWVLGEASWGQGGLWHSGICHKVLLLEHSWTRTVCARAVPGAPGSPLLGHAPHTLGSWAPLAQAVMQSGGFGCRELFEDRSEAFLHPA